jgi:hypothetical protein
MSRFGGNAKTRTKRELQQKIDNSKLINENLEGALNCLAATVWGNFPVMTRDKVKPGEDYLPLFELQGKGDIGIRGMGFVMVKEKLSIRDKYRNISNGYKANGLAPEAGQGIFGIRKLLAGLRRPKKENQRNEAGSQLGREQTGYTPSPAD